MLTIVDLGLKLIDVDRLLFVAGSFAVFYRYNLQSSQSRRGKADFIQISLMRVMLYVASLHVVDNLYNKTLTYNYLLLLIYQTKKWYTLYQLDIIDHCRYFDLINPHLCPYPRRRDRHLQHLKIVLHHSYRPDLPLLFPLILLYDQVKLSAHACAST